jgi:solute carrier family 25 (mitochondrial S-adenosylmethionine transporter), member 26
MNTASIFSDNIVILNLISLIASSFMNVNVQHMAAASMAEITQALVRNPFEVIKQNLQVGKYEGMWECAVDIVKHKGVGGLYNGYFSFIMREIPFSSIQFPFYEILKMT